MPSSSRVTIALSKDLVASLDEEAKRAGVTRGVLIRKALTAYVAAISMRNQASDEVERRAGEFGLFDSGVVERDMGWSPWSEPNSHRIRLPFRFLGEPVLIDPAAPRLERDTDGYPLSPGGYCANYCENCGEHFIRHDDGECPT